MNVCVFITLYSITLYTILFHHTTSHHITLPSALPYPILSYFSILLDSGCGGCGCIGSMHRSHRKSRKPENSQVRDVCYVGLFVFFFILYFFPTTNHLSSFFISKFISYTLYFLSSNNSFSSYISNITHINHYICYTLLYIIGLVMC